MTRRVLFYIAVTALGAILFSIASEYCLQVRGYRAIGGEVFILLLPLWVFIGELVVESLRGQ